jgi:segregation and condensation protein B
VTDSPITASTTETLNAAIEALAPAARVEAVLVTSDRPVRASRLSDVTGLSGAEVRDAVELLNASYESDGRVFRIVTLADGWQILTQPNVAPVLAKLLAAKQQSRLTQAAMETLAIIAYRQPVLRAEIEAIRGVACGEVLRGLLERRLVRISGRAEELGRPMLYGTTREFLRIFGLGGIDDLPEVDGLARTPAYTPPEAEIAPVSVDDGEPETTEAAASAEDGESKETEPVEATSTEPVTPSDA